MFFFLHRMVNLRYDETTQGLSQQAPSRQTDTDGLPPPAPRPHVTGPGVRAATTAAIKRGNTDWARARGGHVAMEESWMASNDEDYEGQDHTGAMSLKDLELEVSVGVCVRMYMVYLVWECLHYFFCGAG